MTKTNRNSYFSDIFLIVKISLVFNKARTLSVLYSCSLMVVRDVCRFPQMFTLLLKNNGVTKKLVCGSWNPLR